MSRGLCGLRALGTTLAAQISDGKARLVHPTQVLLKTAPSGEETIDLREVGGALGARIAERPCHRSARGLRRAAEVLSGKPDAVASTIYHLAGVAYHLLSGEPPFSGSSAAAVRIKVLLEKPVSPRSLRPELSPALDELLLSALDKKPDARPPSIDDFLNRLAVAATLSVAPEAAQSVQLRGVQSAGDRSRRCRSASRRSSGPFTALWGLPFARGRLGIWLAAAAVESEEQAPAPSAMAPVSSEERRVSERIGRAACVAPAPPGGGSASAPGSAMPPPPPASAPAQVPAPPGAPSAVVPMAERAHVRHDSKGKVLARVGTVRFRTGAASLRLGCDRSRGRARPRCPSPCHGPPNPPKAKVATGCSQWKRRPRRPNQPRRPARRKRHRPIIGTKSKVGTVSKMGSKSKTQGTQIGRTCRRVGAIPRESTPSKLTPPRLCRRQSQSPQTRAAGAPSEEPGGAERGLAEPPQPSSIPAPARPKRRSSRRC